MTGPDLGLVIVRVVTGLIFAAHGAQKAFGWWQGPGFAGWKGAMERMGLRPAWFWAAVSTVVELVGGLLLVVGLLTEIAAPFLVAQSLVIIFRRHLAKGFWNHNGGIEFPLSLLGGALAVTASGAGAISLDAAAGIAFADQVRGIILLVALVGALVAMVLRPAEAQAGTMGSPASGSPRPA